MSATSSIYANFCSVLLASGIDWTWPKTRNRPFHVRMQFQRMILPKKKKILNHRQPVVITTVVFIYFSRWDCMLMKNENKFTIFQATFVIIPGATENIAHWFCLFLYGMVALFCLYVCLLAIRLFILIQPHIV